MERVLTLQAEDVLPAQILYAILGEENQRLVPENGFAKDSRGNIEYAVHQELIRYLPASARTGHSSENYAG